MRPLLTLPLFTADESRAILAAGAAAPSNRSVRQNVTTGREHQNLTVAMVDVRPWGAAIQSALDRAMKHFALDTPIVVDNSNYRGVLWAFGARVAPTMRRMALFGLRADTPKPPLTWSDRTNWVACSVALCVADSYQGGDLFARGKAGSRKLGDVSIFPAHWPHEVKLVTAGSRSSLVFWGASPMP